MAGDSEPYTEHLYNLQQKIKNQRDSIKRHDDRMERYRARQVDAEVDMRAQAAVEKKLLHEYQKAAVNNKIPRVDRFHIRAEETERKMLAAEEQARRERLNKNGNYGIRVSQCK